MRPTPTKHSIIALLLLLLASARPLFGQELTTTYQWDGVVYDSLPAAERALWASRWWGSDYYRFERWDPPLRRYHLPPTSDYTLRDPLVFNATNTGVPCNDGPLLDEFGNDWCSNVPNYGNCCASMDSLRAAATEVYSFLDCTLSIPAEDPWELQSLNDLAYPPVLPQEMIVLGAVYTSRVTASFGPGTHALCGTTMEYYLNARAPGHCPGGHQLFESGVCDNWHLAGITVSGAPIAEPTNNCAVGNPCHPATGDKTLSETDFVSDTLPLTRHYHSRQLYPDWAGMGRGWSHTYSSRGMVENGAIKIIDEAGNVERYRCADTPQCTTYASESEPGHVLKVVSGGWEVHLRSGEVRRYDSYRRLISIEDRAGSYRHLTITYNASDAVDRVIDQLGRSLQFNYNAKRQVDSVTLPDGNRIRFEYLVSPTDPTTNARWNLVKVIYQDLTERSYRYDDRDGQGAPRFAHLLTGITDENGVQFATYTYDEQGRVISSERAGGAGLVTLNYTSRPGDGLIWSVTEVTRPLGEVVTHDMEAGPFRKPESIEDSRGSVTMTYDPITSWRTSKTDREGHRTTYVYGDGLHETSRTEAAGTAEARTIETDWNNSVNRVQEIREPGAKTTYTFNTRGQVLTRTVTDTATLATRSWAYTYFEPPAPSPLIGQLESVDGPRTDVSDRTTYEYYTEDHPGGDYLTGDRKAEVNALGHRTDYLKYDANGRPLEILDANHVLTALSYHPRGWLSSRSTDGKTTSFTYDNVGNLTRVTQPDGSYIEYEYDDAHRLEAIADNFNNRVEYVLDAAGNRIAETTFDDVGVLRRQLSRVYDQISQLESLIDGNLDATDYGYDNNGNRTRTLDANLNTTGFEYDGLDRLTRTVDALLGETLMDYDGRNNLTIVTDPLGNVTRYSYDGLDNQTRLESPDSGVTTYEYDDAGNRTAANGARGIRVEYRYDALNRLIDVNYPDTSLDVSFTYDVGTQGKGRLTQMIDAAGTVDYSWDARGNLISETRTMGVDQYVTAYAYNAADRLIQITYPSGMVIDYALDAAGRITAVDQTVDAVAEPLAGNIRHEPFGPVASFTFGNGLTYSATFDQDYELDQLHSGNGLDWVFGYDPVGNILNIDDQIDRLLDQRFAYDDLHRLDTALGGYGLEDYDYDANGNRTRYHNGIVDDAYSYQPQSNRLAGLDGWTFSRDAAGNRTGRLDAGGNGQLYAYGDNDRLTQTSSRDAGGDTVIGEYVYDGRGQRTIKTSGGTTTHFIYGLSGELLGEYRDGAENLLEYVYLNGQPIAVYARQFAELRGPDIELILDNGDPGTSSTGSWQSRTSQQAQGADHLLANKPSHATYRWTPSSPGTLYDVYAWWVDKNNQSDSVPYTIGYGNNETDTVVKSHKTGGGQWQLLGSYYSLGIGDYVEVSSGGSKIVADAIKWVEHQDPIRVATDTTHFIHADHLGTPRRVSDSSQTVIWRWDSSPFGNSEPDEDPDGDSSPFTLNLRFPGQYFDAESGLNYNYFRHYDPQTGRYVESDPAGLDGGLNTFGYADLRPMIGMDPLGLAMVGSWMAPPRFNLTSLSLDDFEWVSPSWSWWGYARFIRIHGHAAGFVNIDIRCEDDCQEWEIHSKVPIEAQGSRDVGPNLYAILIGLRAGPVAGGAAQAALGGLALLEAERHILGLAEEKAGPVIAAALSKGPTAICLISSQGY